MRKNCLLIALIVVASPAALNAASLDDELQGAVNDFNNGKFRDVARRLAPLADQLGSTKTRAGILKYLAAAEWLTRKRDRTNDLFRRALTIDPELDFDPAGFPLPLVEVFNGIRDNLRGTLVVNCVPTGGEVEVVGQALGRCGEAISVRIGRHAVRVRWGQTSLPNPLSVIIPVAQAITIDARAPAVKPPPDTPPPDLGVRKRVLEPTPPKSNKVLGWTLVGSGLAASVAGTILQIVAHNTSRIARNSADAPTYSQAQDLDAKMKREEIASAVLYVVGGSAIVGGVVTLLIDRKRDALRATAPSGFRVTFVRDSTGATVPSLARAWSF